MTTGLRRGEICGLRWSEFDEATGRLNISWTVHKRKAAALHGAILKPKGEENTNHLVVAEHRRDTARAKENGEGRINLLEHL